MRVEAQQPPRRSRGRRSTRCSERRTRWWRSRCQRTSNLTGSLASAGRLWLSFGGRLSAPAIEGIEQAAEAEKAAVKRAAAAQRAAIQQQTDAEAQTILAEADARIQVTRRHDSGEEGGDYSGVRRVPGYRPSRSREHAWYEYWLVGIGITIIALGDVVGPTPIIEGIMGEEAITGRKLTDEERAHKITTGVLMIATLFIFHGISEGFGKGGGETAGGPERSTGGGPERSTATRIWSRTGASGPSGRLRRRE